MEKSLRGSRLVSASVSPAAMLWRRRRGEVGRKEGRSKGRGEGCAASKRDQKQHGFTFIPIYIIAKQRLISRCPAQRCGAGAEGVDRSIVGIFAPETRLLLAAFASPPLRACCPLSVCASSLSLQRRPAPDHSERLILAGAAQARSAEAEAGTATRTGEATTHDSAHSATHTDPVHPTWPQPPQHPPPPPLPLLLLAL